MARNERSRPAGNRTAPDDLLAGGITVDVTDDLAAVVEDSLPLVVALLMNAPDVGQARDILVRLPSDVPDPVLGFWLAGIRLCSDAGVICLPVTAADAAMRAGIEPPPAMRGHVVSSGWALAAKAGTLPFACAADLVRIIREGQGRRAAEMVGERIRAVAWHGEVSDLAEIIRCEASAVLALLAEVTR